MTRVLWKETYEKRPVKRDPFKEIGMYKKRPIHVKRDHICKKRPIHVKRDLDM